MNPIITDVSVDVCKVNLFSPILAKQKDTNSRFLRVKITDHDTPVAVDANAFVTINAQREDGQRRSFSGTVLEDGRILVPLTNWMLQREGAVRCDISVYESDQRENRLTTTAFGISVEETAQGEEEEISPDDEPDAVTQCLLTFARTAELCDEVIADAELITSAMTSISDATARAENAITQAEAATSGATAATASATAAVASVAAAIEALEENEYVTDVTAALGYTPADKSQTDLAAKKLDYLTKLTKGQAWDVEKGTTPAREDAIPQGAKCVSINRIGGKSHTVGLVIDGVEIFENPGDTPFNIPFSKIQKIVGAGLAEEYYHVGDQLTCRKNGTDLVWDIIGFDCEDLLGSDVSSMTLQLHDGLSPQSHFGVSGNTNYAESLIRSRINSTSDFLSGMDEEFLEAVGTVQKVTALAGGGSVETNDKFFILSRAEVGGRDESSGVEGGVYPYYANPSAPTAGTDAAAASRIRYQGNATYWWLRSCSSATNAHLVFPDGHISNTNCDRNSGVFPACAITAPYYLVDNAEPYDVYAKVTKVKSVGKNLNPTSPVHAYVWGNDFRQYNPANAVNLEAGTYTISASGRIPYLQFFDAQNGFAPLLAADVVTAKQRLSTYWDGYALLGSSEAYHNAQITLNAPVVMTMASDGAALEWLQIEKGTASTDFSPYREPSEYVVPAAVQNLPGYGSEGSYLDLNEKVFVCGGASTPVDLPDDNLLDAEGGGTLVFEQTGRIMEIPNDVDYAINLSEAI